MTVRIEIPDGMTPPADWQGRASVPLAEFRAWLSGAKPQKQGRSKYGALAGFRKDLGFSTRSKLEANLARVLMFEGYVRWPHKDREPPLTGRFFRYEGRRFEFELIRKDTGRVRKVETYLCDYEVWTDGRYEIRECKGYMDARGKRKLRLMAEFHPDIPVIVVTVKELTALRREAEYRDRRNGGTGVIPGWE